MPATPAIEAGPYGIAPQGIPVVPYVTDIAASLWLAHVGMENRRKGVACPMPRMGRREGSRMLITLSSQLFRGEDERRVGFLDHLARHDPPLPTLTVSEGP